MDGSPPGTDKFLAAETREDVAGSKRRVRNFDKELKHPIAGRMAMGIVHLLEMVQVEHRHRDEYTLPFGFIRLRA